MKDEAKIQSIESKFHGFTVVAHHLSDDDDGYYERYRTTHEICSLSANSLLGCLAPVQPNSYGKRLNATTDLEEVFI